MSELTQQRLKEVLKYDPGTGLWERIDTGKSAGCVAHRGYVLLRVDGKLYLSHRLAWLYMTGKWPVGVIDHLNGKSNALPICEMYRSQSICKIEL